MSKFDELLQELSAEQAALAKALPADDGDGDEKIAAAAAEGGGQDAGDAEGGDTPPNDDEGNDAPMAKSFKVTLADGTEAEAMDATELVKSLQDQVGALTGRLGEAEEGLAKSLGATLELVKGQQSLIKSLTERVEKLAGEGRGRKAVVNVHEKPAGEPTGTLAKSEGAGFDAAGFMLKANEAFNAQKLSGLELTAIDVALRNRAPIDPAIISKVMS